MTSNLIGNRKSSLDVPSASLLAPSSARDHVPSRQYRAGSSMGDLGTFSVPMLRRNIRPASEVLPQPPHDSLDRAAQEWVADIDQYQTTLEEMAAATLDQEFKGELSSIERWFGVLSEAERTAALYSLLQQTTQVQIRFFIQVLRQMSQSNPITGVLSPANFEKDPMTNRLNDAMSKLNIDSSRTPATGGNIPPVTKRHSAIDPSTINALFPDAAAAIAQQKAEFTQQTATPAPSRNNSTFPSNSLLSPTSAAPDSKLDEPPMSPWAPRPSMAQPPISRPKSASGLKLTQNPSPVGQYRQMTPNSGLRSPASSSTTPNPQSASINVPDLPSDPSLLSPHALGGSSWASMSSTPLATNFNHQQSNQADMVANATAMKLAALSTVNSRFVLDEAPRFRRSRANGNRVATNNPVNASNSTASNISPAATSPGPNVIMVNDAGQSLNNPASFQGQNPPAVAANPRSRPNSPHIPLPNSSGIGTGSGFSSPLPFSPQNNGFLAAYDINRAYDPMGGLSHLSTGEGYLSDHTDISRGRSPRGRRGNSKPPEDPTDPNLLRDIPSWLRSLRLHKYTDNLKDLSLSELIELDDKGLEERGVNALGARNKMLKVFDQVKEVAANGKLKSII